MKRTFRIIGKLNLEVLERTIVLNNSPHSAFMGNIHTQELPKDFYRSITVMMRYCYEQGKANATLTNKENK